MVTGMVAASVSGFAADVEKKWLAELTHESSMADAIGAGRRVAGRVLEASGSFGLSGQAEREWLKILSTRA